MEHHDVEAIEDLVKRVRLRAIMRLKSILHSSTVKNKLNDQVHS